jgi:hypothetical protein
VKLDAALLPGLRSAIMLQLDGFGVTVGAMTWPRLDRLLSKRSQAPCLGKPSPRSLIIGEEDESAASPLAEPSDRGLHEVGRSLGGYLRYDFHYECGSDIRNRPNLSVFVDDPQEASLAIVFKFRDRL